MADMKTRAAAIKALEDQFGRVTAERLLEAASNGNHPLHEDFLWDDAKAAHKHRLDQARVMISSVRIVITDTTRKIVTQGYVRDPNAPSHLQGYVAVTQLRTEREASHEALLAEATRLQAQLDRMRDIALGLDLGDELDAVVESVMILRSKLRPEKATEEMRAN